MDSFVIALTFIVFLLVFTGIGALSSRQRQDTTSDYLVAGRSVGPWMTALSAVSTNNSGYMFVGLIGFAYRVGLEAVWITAGWVVGDYITWLWVHRRVREQSEEVGACSVSGLLAADPQHRSHSRTISVATALLTFIFLGGYAAAQLKAGSTALHSLFGWPHWAGAVIGVTVVTIYCMSGGLRASIWTDAAQSMVMLLSMGLLVMACAYQVGGPMALMLALEDIDSSLVAWFPSGLRFGFGLYLLGFVMAGTATIAQPHVLVRFMAVESGEAIPRTRRIYFLWYSVFSAFAFGVGLYARVLLPDLVAGLEGEALIQASEGALPELSLALLPPVFVGMMLAGLFSATMSTADSQILSCSAAITQDLFPRWRMSYLASKLATLTVAGLALGIALGASSGVFALVLLAWSVLGASLGPIIVVRVARLPLPASVALWMMGLGMAGVFAWGKLGLSSDLYRLVPGLVAAFLVYAIYLVWRRPLAR